MIKDKLNNDDLKDINGGIGQIDFDALKQLIDTDTNLKGLINAIPESCYFDQNRRKTLLKMLDSGSDSSVRKVLYETAKINSKFASVLIIYYKIK